MSCIFVAKNWVDVTKNICQMNLSGNCMCTQGPWQHQRILLPETVKGETGLGLKQHSDMLKTTKCDPKAGEK